MLERSDFVLQEDHQIDRWRRSGPHLYGVQEKSGIVYVDHEEAEASEPPGPIAAPASGLRHAVALLNWEPFLS